MPDDNRWNRTGHILLGIAAALVPGLDYYAAWREIDQLPMENDEYPAQFLDMAEIVAQDENDDDAYGPVVEYWAAPRVLDSLNDSREVAIGKEIGRWVAWAGVAALGAWVF